MKLKYIKQITIAILLSLLISCSKEKEKKAIFDDLITPEAHMVIQFDDFSGWKENLNNQNFLSKHKSSTLLDFWSLKEFEALIDLPEELLLCYNTLGKNEIVKTLIFNQNKADTLKLASKQSYEYESYSIKVLSQDQKEFYSTEIGGFRILSHSKIILENLIRNYINAIKPPKDVTKLLNALSSDSPSVVINTDLFPNLSSNFFNTSFPKDFLSLSEHLGFDLKFDEEKLFFNGIVFSPKDENKDWSVFSRVKAEESLVAEVVPRQFVNLKSLILEDYYKVYPGELATLKPLEKDSILINIKEISDVEINEGHARIFVSKNIEQTFKSLDNVSNPRSKFGSIQIYEINKTTNLGKVLQPYLAIKELNYFIVVKDFVISANKTETLENFIIQINSDNVLMNDLNYSNHMNALYSKSHMLWISNMAQQSKTFETNFKSDYQKAFKSLDWTENEFIISQLLVEDNFAYLNILSKKTPADQTKVEVQQQIRLKHDQALVSAPQFFKNWRTGQHDLAFQDITNTLFLKDTKGNLIWSKKLDSRIIGHISIIDIYQNKRLQLAFATEDKVHVIDKNGNEVAPFPIKSKKAITQSLSVFDYDKNGKHRFVAVMEDKVRMYDKEAKRVRGFKFRNTKAPIAFPLKHIRIETKDYILAQESSGKLNILDRKGKERVELDKTFRHTENEWFEHDKKFVSVNDKGNILEIDQNGKLKTLKKEWLNPKFSASKNYLVSMSENELKINDKTIELPFGVYTQPLIMKNHVAIADTQAQKVYVMDFEGTILEGFPAFGKRITDHYYQAGNLFLLCQDEDDAILVYKASFK